MRGFFEPIDSLLELVEIYCSRSNELSDLLLFESDWIKGSTQLQLNDFVGGLRTFERGYKMTQSAVEKGLISANDDRIAIASGLMGNGYMAVNQFNEAEKWYLKAFQMWDVLDDNIFLDKQLFISNTAVCLTCQDKLQEAEELLLHSIRDKEDEQSFRVADSLYTLGNVRIAQNNLDQALEHFKKAFLIFRDELGERHRLTANCCYCIAWLLNRQRKYNAAISMFEQTLSAYEDNSYYYNECIRTKYMLGTVQIEHGDSVVGQAHIDEARNMLREMKPEIDVMAWVENDYDLLVMPWSR